MSIPISPKPTNDDASFCLHFNGGEDAVVPKIEGTTIESLISTISSHPIFLKKNTGEDDGEIEVFGAEKYFSEGLHQSPKVTLKNSSSPHHQKDDSLGVFSIKLEDSTIDAPRARSESSWHSRSSSMPPLPNIRRNQKKRYGKPKKRGFFTTIGYRCCCTDKNSVEIDDASGEGCSRGSTNTALVIDKGRHDFLASQSTPDYNYVKFNERELRANSEGQFSFRAGKMEVDDDDEDEANRNKSSLELEVIPIPALENGKGLRSMMMPPWDAIAEEIKIPFGTHNDDLSSESMSSDLFEIKSLSKGSPFLSRQASDIPSAGGSITPKTGGYAPSDQSSINISPDYQDLQGFYSPNAIIPSSPRKLIISSEETRDNHSTVNGEKAVSLAGNAQGIVVDQPPGTLITATLLQ